jgi:hypothetical protein
MDKQGKLSNPSEWEALAIAVVTHWYLVDDQFSPKMAIEWFDRLIMASSLI